jgi:hypothetical protein
MLRLGRAGRTAILSVLASSFLSGGMQAAGPQINEWASIANDRLGFRIAYPADVFEEKSSAKSSEGQVFVSRDGKAKLLVGAFANSDGFTMAEYRDFLIRETYAGAEIDYAPVRNTWFVLSGNRNGETFYQRVSFTCGGQLITSWAMLYPEAEKQFYDRIVEKIAPTYAPATSRSGNCSVAAAEPQPE